MTANTPRWNLFLTLLPALVASQGMLSEITQCITTWDCNIESEGNYCADGVCMEVGTCYLHSHCNDIADNIVDNTYRHCTNGGECVFRAQRETPCNTTETCFQGEYCTTSGICKRGGDCFEDEDCSLFDNFHVAAICDAEPYCDEENVCQKECPLVPGAECTESSNCGEDSQCSNGGICIYRPGCESSDDCFDGDYCDTQGICRPGGTCFDDEDCTIDDNFYTAIICPGTSYCAQDGLCARRCEAPLPVLDPPTDVPVSPPTDLPVDPLTEAPVDPSVDSPDDESNGALDDMFSGRVSAPNTRCKVSSNCEGIDHYCTTSGVCKPSGSCLKDEDCALSDHFYQAIICDGTHYCTETGLCSKNCRGADDTAPPIPDLNAAPLDVPLLGGLDATATIASDGGETLVRQSSLALVSFAAMSMLQALDLF